MIMKKVYAYLRTSIDKGEKSNSAESQLNEIKSFCDENNMVVVKSYYDNGISGAEMYKPKFEEMLEDIKSKQEVDTVIVWRLDRLTRDSSEYRTIEGRTYLSGADILSATEPFMNGDDVNKRLMKSLLFSIAEYERSITRMRTLSGKKNKLKTLSQSKEIHDIKNVKVGGKLPYGFANEEQAEIVRKIFKAKSMGSTQTDIARVMNSRKIPSPTGKKWTQQTVSFILKNEEKYRGNFRMQFNSYKEVKDGKRIHKIKTAVNSEYTYKIKAILTD